MSDDKVVPIRERKLADPEALWTKRGLAIAFNMSDKTVAKRLAGVPPDGQARGPLYSLRTAIHYLFEVQTRKDGGSNNLDDMSPRDRRDHISAEFNLLKMREYAGDLIPSDVHREHLAETAKLMVQPLATLPDVLEREADLSGRQVAKVMAVVDSIRRNLFNLVHQKSGGDSGDDKS